MKNPEWPGIATAVAIILIVMIAADLSKWQTIASALIAFGGGVLAYRGAMAKVREDAAEHKREFLRRQLAIYLKLDLATRRLHQDAQELDGMITFRVADDKDVSASHIVIKEPPEIAEAWDNLDVFPRRLIREIASIRASIQRIHDLLEGLGPTHKLYGGTQTRLTLIHENVSAIVGACKIVFEGLEPEIEQLAPNMPERERMLRVYGEVWDGK
ncbi:hypothetical protein AC629_10915 [Bradyrhizobium sp. NAS80.1]|uniref:hypothetical protein n=1 Tax=Bradyrhizobium sp. NAS80.1 TaxID=1680159 RepID=UPI00096470B9|nr:hypothetical protein [Bradyrhizobium sp. NAS80.1]OKO88052.1 hypothetical protein AC629_10915 [Bradyrhizobium sp. NAS80.1]